MAQQIVLDASAMLVILLGEPGGQAVTNQLRASVMSAVNHAEVGANLSKRGYGRDQIERLLSGWATVVVPFDLEHSLETIRLQRLTAGARLSLADRACLALARISKLPVLTTDRKWSELSIDVDVRQIR